MAPAFLQRFTGGNQTPLQALWPQLRRRCDFVLFQRCFVLCFCPKIFGTWIVWFILTDVFWCILLLLILFLVGDFQSGMAVAEFGEGLGSHVRRWSFLSLLLPGDWKFGFLPVPRATMNDNQNTNRVEIHWRFPDCETKSNSASKMPTWVLRGSTKNHCLWICRCGEFHFLRIRIQSFHTTQSITQETGQFGHVCAVYLVGVYSIIFQRKTSFWPITDELNFGILWWYWYIKIYWDRLETSKHWCAVRPLKEWVNPPANENKILQPQSASLQSDFSMCS